MKIVQGLSMNLDQNLLVSIDQHISVNVLPSFFGFLCVLQLSSTGNVEKLGRNYM